jgi:hypothetical protein
MFVLPSEAHVKERITSKPEVVGSSFGLVPPNALVLIEPITSRRSTLKLLRNGDRGDGNRNETGKVAQTHEAFWLPKNLRVSALATHSF